MPDRIMFVHLKTGYDTDAGPSWISRVRFTKSWRTAYFHGRTLRRVTGTANANFDANFYDVESDEGYWISGPKRDRSDGRYRHQKPIIEEDVRAEYEAFLAGAPLPGRESG
ncbi:hypothetical protein [Microbacterium terricola]|uniref:1-deoxy-D-xylulose-5-phosphate synthase n=1 Tax=Microbacterium terricola TaxID=344163 RepID=A0ABM8DUW7_9MICO|nr:hypothetical protein [Microbacterium terricola]UYK39866.1 hypothetical protein OAU46_14395 [Microbacterium terricola]BDV29379.1 hypothetical protein Microterr_00390 [Microbacterium terricola]